MKLGSTYMYSYTLYSNSWLKKGGTFRKPYFIGIQKSKCKYQQQKTKNKQ